MKWPWAAALERQDRIENRLREIYDALTDEIARLEAEIAGIDSTVESWEKAVLLAQVMRPPEPAAVHPPAGTTDLPRPVELALRSRAEKGSALYNDMAQDASRMLEAGMDPEDVAQAQLRGSRIRVW